MVVEVSRYNNHQWNEELMVPDPLDCRKCSSDGFWYVRTLCCQCHQHHQVCQLEDSRVV